MTRKRVNNRKCIRGRDIVIAESAFSPDFIKSRATENTNACEMIFLQGSLPPATKLGQGYIFTGVYDSVHRGGVCSRGSVVCSGGGVSAPGGSALGGGCLLLGGCLVLGGLCVPGEDPPPGRPLLRAVRILLECNLVLEKIFL